MALGAGHETWAAGQAPKAKSVIARALGGPSHIDMFDPKPDAPSDFRGPFGTIPTRTPGMHHRAAAQDGQAFEHVQRDPLHVPSNGGHPGAGTVGLTGFEERPTVPEFRFHRR